MRWINTKPSRGAQLCLMLLPFALVVIAYALGSAARLAENANDKLLPGLGDFVDTINRMAFMADQRTGEFLLWADTWASVTRLVAGLGISTAIALVIGMLIGMLPYLRALLAPFVATISMVPPLALLPILFIVMGLGEASKITLIIVGVAPTMIRDLALKALELPREQIVKAETLGGSSWQIALRVVLPQILPRLITCLRLQLGPAWLFLIAAEAISSDSGLGYRIFLVRRYLSMDIIFPYVAWITLLAVVMNDALDRLRIAVFPWSELEKQGMSELVIEKVWKEYDAQIVLEDVSLTVASRAFVALVGPSGCGKTTFLRMLLGQGHPTRGTIRLDGTPLPKEPGPDRGVVFQRYSVFPHLTVLGNVLLGIEFGASRHRAKLFGAARRTAVEEARRMIGEVGLASAEGKYPAQLSGGMQQRLALAQALIMKPKVLLLDEPFGALDPGIRAEIHMLMKRLWHETQMTVVMVTHDMREAFTLATRVVAFERRRDRPEEKERYGATITRDISIWPPRIAGAASIFSPDRDGPVLSQGQHRDGPAPSGDKP